MKEIIRKSTFIITSLFLCNLIILAQEHKQINGLILNDTGDPIEGVSVSIEGSDSTPAVSGENGEFNLKTDKSGVWIIISPLETYKNKRLYLPSYNYENAKIYLTRIGISSGYDDMLMVGGEEKRRNQLSPVYDLSSNIFNTLPYSSLLQYLQGTVPGAFFVNHSGMPGSGGTLYLRGLRSINSHNTPLIIVDGMPIEDGSLYGSVVNGYSYNPLSIIEQQDISNISIIGGGTGSTLYGVKGANGLIMIETLKPTETKTSINFSLKSGVYFKPDQLPQLNAREYKTLANELLSSSDIFNELYSELYPGLFITQDEKDYIRYSHDFNWQNEVFTNSIFSDAYLSVKGGDAIGKYGLSIGYLNHNSIYHNTGFNRFTARFVGSFNVFDWLKMNVSANLASSDSEIKESALTPQVNPILTSLFKTPMMFPYQYDDNDNKMTVLDNVDELGVSNPTAVMRSFNARNSNNRFLTAVRLEGDITSNLTFNSLMGLNLNSLRQTAFYPNQGMEYYAKGEVFNISNSMTNNLYSLFNNNYLSFRNLFSYDHHISAMIGVKWYTNIFEEDLGIARNLNENDEYRFLQSGTPFLRDMGGAIYNWKWLSNYINLHYSYKDRYLLDLATSADLSSNIGRIAENTVKINDFPFGVFYSAGAGWRLSQERFLNFIEFLEDLKLRVEYSTSGNDNIGYLSRHNFYKLALYRETSGMVPGGYGNDYIKYEENKQINLGADISIYGGRYSFSVDYYKMNISDLLIYEQLESYLGFENFPSNMASMTNLGIELNLFTRLIKTREFSADFNINFVSNKNQITGLETNEDLLSNSNKRQATVIIEMPGYELINQRGIEANSFYGYNYLGVFSTTEEAYSANIVNDRGIPFGAGDAKFEDISGPDGNPDGVINEFDKIVLGSAQPEIFGGISLNLKYKRWSFDMLWQYVYGNGIYNYIRYQNEKMTDLSNQSISTRRRWSSEGQETDITRALWNDPVGNTSFSSRWIEDGSYIRLKYIRLSFDIKSDILFFQNLSAYITATNLFTITKYLGYDPEFAHSQNTLFQGVDYGLMPQARSFMIGIQFGL